jgi:hypothetical protein
MGVSHSLARSVRQHYLKTFGPYNQRIVIRNHTFVCLDAPGLVDEDYQRSAQGVPFEQWSPAPGGPIEFVQTMPIGAYSKFFTYYHLRVYRS